MDQQTMNYLLDLYTDPTLGTKTEKVLAGIAIHMNSELTNLKAEIANLAALVRHATAA